MKNLFVVLCLISASAFACSGADVGINCMPRPDGVVQVSDEAKREMKRFESDVVAGRLPQRMNLALDTIVRFSAWKLRAKGYKKEADSLIGEWDQDWNGYILRRDIGDHGKPLSMWLHEKYLAIELILGADVCEALRISDIKYLNWCVPMVLFCPDSVGVDEFGVHFVPLAGTVIFWTSYIGCTAGTFGTGFWACGLLSTACEFGTEKWLAPKLNPTIWKRSCGEEESPIQSGGPFAGGF